jgi:hypothetical protein
MMQQSTVSDTVEAGWPAFDSGNVDGGLTQEMVVLEMDGLASLVASPDIAAQPALPSTMGDTDARVTVPLRNTINGEGDDPPIVGPNAHTPCVLWMKDELWTNDPLLQFFTGADQKLHGVFGDTIRHNDGCHLNGGIGEDKDCKWQRLHERIIAACLPLYSRPNGRWAKQFLALQTTLCHRPWH